MATHLGYSALPLADTTRPGKTSSHSVFCLPHLWILYRVHMRFYRIFSLHSIPLVQIFLLSHQCWVHSNLSNHGVSGPRLGKSSTMWNESSLPVSVPEMAILEMHRQSPCPLDFYFQNSHFFGRVDQLLPRNNFLSSSYFKLIILGRKQALL